MASFVHIGARFELLSQRYLKKFCGIQLEHLGQSHDGGVDLRGHWTINRQSVNDDGNTELKIPVIAQCKRTLLKRSLAVNHFRDFESNLALNQHQSPPLQSSFTLGLVISNASISSEARKRLLASPWPLIFIQLSDEHIAMEEELQPEDKSSPSDKANINIDHFEDLQALVWLSNITVERSFTKLGISYNSAMSRGGTKSIPIINLDDKRMILK